MEVKIKEDLIRLIGELKPKIRERAAFKFGEFKTEDGKLVLADTSFLTKPPVITFYLKSIKKMCKKHMIEFFFTF